MAAGFEPATLANALVKTFHWSREKTEKSKRTRGSTAVLLSLMGFFDVRL